MSQYMSPYMLKEYLDFHEVASLSVTGCMLKGKAYKSNNDIIELERRLLNAIIDKEINAKKYITYKLIVFLFNWFYYIPGDGRIRMRPADVTELYKKWGYFDRCFNIDTAQPESAQVPSKIPWIAPDNAFAEFVSELWKKGYIAADSDADAFKKTAPHFTVNSNSDTLRKGLALKRDRSSHFDSIPKASDFEEGEDCFSGIKPARRRINRS